LNIFFAVAGDNSDEGQESVHPAVRYLRIWYCTVWAGHRPATIQQH